MRFGGLYTRHWSSSSTPGGPRTLPRAGWSSQGWRRHLGKLAEYSFSSSTPGQTCWWGVPSWRKILKRVSISESPANRGDPLAISARMAPMDHTSQPSPYSFLLRRISGGRYHTVTTSCVRTGIGRAKALANPKSAIFSWFLSSISKLAGFRSLWITRRAWQNSNPTRSCLKRVQIVAADSGLFARRNLFKSLATYSNTSNNFFCEQWTSYNLTTFTWCSSFNTAISRIAVLGIPSSSCSSFIRFIAITVLVWVSLTLKTSP
mmetsp:Transcript_29977/g.65904  ORF Transcript_29977/g.65904 Transcript_29977/m.65904 type:complete len:262 (+) Transcript_29977:416-1201(+)